MRVAFVFPGQGSQGVGMGRELHASSPAARAVFAQADEALGYGISELCFAGPEDSLRETIHAQPAIVASSLACCAALAERMGSSAPTPIVVAGHSVGEYSALVVAGALDLAAALVLVRERARCMHLASQQREGTMAAVLGLPAPEVEAACHEVQRGGGGTVAIANDNAADQVVISGDPGAVERAGALARERGARRVVRLAASGAFHSALMDGAAACFAPAVAQAPLRDARVPLVANVNAECVTSASKLRAELAVQVRAPVQWTKTMDTLVDMGVTHAVELGPGQVLTGLLRRRGGMEVCNVDGPAGVERAAQLLA